MNYKYQLIILGSSTGLLNGVLGKFWERILDLGLSLDNIIIIDKQNFYKFYSGNSPSYCLYFGNQHGRFEDLDILEKLIVDGTITVPIFYENEKFADQIPSQLGNHNGFLYDDMIKSESLVSLVLEGFSLLRSSRRLFLSYKRNESRSVAIQLFEEFEKNGFDVFLDTHSIRPGEPFQDELWNRMTDCDVIVVLNTPNFLDSMWCKEEIAEANCKLIGIVQLVWPNHRLENMAELCLPINLKDHHFINEIYDNKDESYLTSAVLNKITNEVESIRARNLASRQDNIITEFTNASKKLSLKMTLQPEKYLSQRLVSGKDRIFIPTVGIPQSFSCNQSEDLISDIKRHNVEGIYLLYDHFRIRDKWLKHLEWLNKYLKVQTLKIKDVELWLSRN